MGLCSPQFLVSPFAKNFLSTFSVADTKFDSVEFAGFGGTKLLFKNITVWGDLASELTPP